MSHMRAVAGSDCSGAAVRFQHAAAAAAEATEQTPRYNTAPIKPRKPATLK
jgi:hypothetical protein